MALNPKKNLTAPKQPPPDLPAAVATTAPAPEPKRPPGPGLPRRIVVFVVIRDESGSMRPWRQRQGEFIPGMRQGLIASGGAKAADLVYVLYVVVSGGVVTTDFAPLSKAADPAFEPDGHTPIGAALAATAEKVEAFLVGTVFPAETTVKALEVVVVSDLVATGEEAGETDAGVAAFTAMAKKYRATVTVVGPSPEAMNHGLAARLDLGGKGVVYLDSDPAAVLKVTFDSLVAASRVLTGSRPHAGKL